MMQKRHEQAQHFINRLGHWWRTVFLLRWAVANILGWMLGLILLSVTLWLLGWIGALILGAGIGVGIGVPQAWILFAKEASDLRRKWVLYSAIGGFVAIFPIAALAIVALANIWIATLLISLIFGGLFGYFQALVLEPELGYEAYRWVLVNLVAALVSGLVLVALSMTFIPIVLSPATILYALITGWQLKKWGFAA